MNVQIHHLRFTVEAQNPVHFGPQAGAQLRGAFWKALQTITAHIASVENPYSPVNRLIALETQSARGANPPRPFAIRPPLAVRAENERCYSTGEVFSFGINLFGDIVALFPYVVKAVYEMGKIGVGYGRGQFVLLDVQAVNPLTRKAQALLSHDGRVTNLQSPMVGLPVTLDNIRQTTQLLSPQTVRLRFLTPTQLTHQKRTLPRPDFRVLVARLLERCQAIDAHYTTSATPRKVWETRHQSLTQAAERVCVKQDNTRWIAVRSGSRRSDYRTDVGGFVGEVLFDGDLSPFLSWLVWGQSLHVGKNVVKGNGWYEIAKG